MELDCRSEMSVQELCDSLHRELYEANPSEVSAIPLWYQNYCLSGALSGERTISERCLHYGNHLYTMGGFRLLLPCRLLKPLMESFRSHNRWDP